MGIDDWKEDADVRLPSRALPCVAAVGAYTLGPTRGAEWGARARGASLCLLGRPSIPAVRPVEKGVGTGTAVGVIERIRGVRSDVLLKKRWREVEDVVYGIGTCS